MCTWKSYYLKYANSHLLMNLLLHSFVLCFVVVLPPRPFHVQLTSHVRYSIHKRKIEPYTDIYQHEAIHGNQI